MAVPEAPLDKIKYESAVLAVSKIPQSIQRLENALKASATATLAAAVINAAHRPISIQEAMDIQRDIYFATYSGEFTGNGVYQEWAKTKDARLKKVVA